MDQQPRLFRCVTRLCSRESKCYYSPPPMDCQKSTTELDTKACRRSSFRRSSARRSSIHVPLASWLNSNINNFDLAHIHAVFNHSSVAAAEACRKSGVPYIIRPLGTLDPWSMTQKSLRKRLFWQFSGKAMLRNAAAVHYTSEVEKLSTEATSRVESRKSDRARHRRKRLPTRMVSFEAEPYVLVLSRLHPKKGLDVLIDAFVSLIQNGEVTELATGYRG